MLEIDGGGGATRTLPRNGGAEELHGELETDRITTEMQCSSFSLQVCI